MRPGAAPVSAFSSSPKFSCVAVLVDVAFDDLPELGLDGFEIAFFGGFACSCECLPFVLLCFPDAARPIPHDPRDYGARARAAPDRSS